MDDAERKNGEMLQIKRILVLFFFLALIITTGISVFEGSMTRDHVSSHLTTRNTEEDNKTRTDYVDGKGKITYATDKYYATIIRYFQDGLKIREEYYDEDGEPAKQPSGHYALTIERDEKGRGVCTTYLGIDGRPVTTINGYAKIRYVFNDKDQKELEYYCDADDNPVSHKDGYFGIHREYGENGKASVINYLDENGQAVNNKNGYAKVTRIYNDAGKVAYEYYFDENGKPVPVFSGYYCLYREYDESGRTTLTTYLDKDGNPTKAEGRYATSVNTYNSDGTLSTTRYYDAEGKPATNGHNQYGVEYVNGQEIYLDENGERMLRLDNFLGTHPLLVMIAGVALTLIAAALRGRGKALFLILYLAFIILMTIWNREPGVSKGAFQVFWSYRQFFSSDSLRQEILNNIWLFMPLGALLYDASHPYAWICAVGLSLGIETVQYFAGIGLGEIDDVISNSIGAALGCGIAMSLKTFKAQKSR